MENQTEMLILTLPQVIDAALTGPEMGIVSFRLLNNILHVMCQQLNLEDVKLQYQGIQAMQIEKIWNPEMKGKLPQLTAVKRTKLTTAEEDEEEKIVVIPDGPSERFPSMTLAISNTQLHSMERNIKSLQKEVADLKTLPSNTDLFKAVKPKSGEPSPIVDMYQILSVTKRMDATEQAVMKIASFMEDLARFVQSEDFSGLGEEFGSQAERPPTRRDSANLERRQSKESTFDRGKSKGKVMPVKSEKSREFGSPAITGASESFTHESESLKRTPSGAKYPKTLDVGQLGRRLSSSSKTEHPVVMMKGNIGEEGFTEKRIKERTFRDARGGSLISSSMASGNINMLQLPEAKLKGVNVRNLPSGDALDLIQEDLKNLRSVVESLCNVVSSGAHVPPSEVISTHINVPHPTGQLPVGSFSSSMQSPIASITGSISQPPNERMGQIEMRVNQCISQINKMDSIFSSSYSGITNRMAEIESSLKLLSNKALQDVARADLEEQLTQNIFSLNEKVANLESLVSKLSEAVASLIEENSAKQNKFMNLTEDVATLKSDKVGREEFTEALAEKVDICMINRKVSHDQFNATCDDLSKGIEEALVKLMEQEDLWHIALKEIQEEISEKLSKDDLSPLREFVTDKLKGLQHKVKTLTKMKQEQEAAATKSKFLTGVQCISCDKDVIMRKKIDETFTYPGAPMLPPTKNIAPYLAYELDQLRKQQRQLQFGKNLNHFESATRDSKGVVNRYCGGSHTITTPQQRVTRIGNFVEQWMPKTVPVEREILHCEPDKGNNQEIANRSKATLMAKGSRESLTVNNTIKHDQAEKDEGGQDTRKSGGDTTKK